MRKRLVMGIAAGALALGGFGIAAQAGTPGRYSDQVEGYKLYNTEAFTDGCLRDYLVNYRGMVTKKAAKSDTNEEYSQVASHKHKGMVHLYDDKGKGC